MMFSYKLLKCGTHKNVCNLFEGDWHIFKVLTVKLGVKRKLIEQWVNVYQNNALPGIYVLY